MRWDKRKRRRDPGAGDGAEVKDKAPTPLLRAMEEETNGCISIATWEELKQDEIDARRYRWMKENNYAAVGEYDGKRIIAHMKNGEMDQLIDEAIDHERTKSK